MISFESVPFNNYFGSVVHGKPDINIWELERDFVINLFKKTHFILFKDFAVDIETFALFSERISDGKFISYAGGAYARQKINGNETILSVTGNDLHFVPAHGEMYYVENRPDLIWFYCATPACDGGETTVFDAALIYQQLSSETKNLLHSKRLKYIRKFPDGFWQKIYLTDNLDEVAEACAANHLSLTVNSDRSISTEYVRSAFVEDPEGDGYLFLNNILPVTMLERRGATYNILRLEDGSSIPDSIIADIEAVTQRLAVPIPWQTGNIAMVDNARLLHGRRPFKDEGRSIYVRMAKLSC